MNIQYKYVQLFFLQMRMRTLERKKSSAGRSNGHPFNGSLHTNGNGSQHHRNVNQINANSSSRQEKNEFDDLISALRTGDVFGENMDKFKRSRKIRHSPPRVDRMDSFLRERSKEATYRQK